MSEYYVLLTARGQALEAEALASGQPVRLTQMAVGDGTDPPSQTQTALQAEVWRGDLNAIYTDEENPNWVVAEIHIPPGDGGFTIREIGLFTADGELFAVGNHPQVYKPRLTDGTAVDLHLKVVCAVTNAESIELLVDPSIVMATRQHVAEECAKRADRDHKHDIADVRELSIALKGKANTGHGHGIADVSGLQAVLDSKATGEHAHPDATTTKRGLALMATSAKVDAGTCAVSSVPPKELKRKLSELQTSLSSLIPSAATDPQVLEGLLRTCFVTPGGLSSALPSLLSGFLGTFPFSHEETGYQCFPSGHPDHPFITQWGNVGQRAAWESWAYDIVFPLAFSRSIFLSTAIGEHGGDTLSVSNVTLTGCKVSCYDQTSRQIGAAKWFAFGI